MRASWLIRIAAVLAAGFVFLFAGGPAWAVAVVELNQGNVPTTAVDFDTHVCGEFGGGPLPGQDIWVFTLEDRNVHGNFVSVTATFTERVKTAPSDGGIDNSGGASTAWVIAPAGWTLQTATAIISGDAGAPQDFFMLMHTCPASGTPSASPTTSPSPTRSPAGSPSPSESPSESPSVSPSESVSTTPPTSSTPKPSGAISTGGGGRFMNLSNVLLGGGALLGAVAGIGFLMLARQRRDLA